MGVPRTILVLLFLSGVYWIAARFLDQSPEARDLENPYHVLRHVERDARLRSSFHDVRATLWRQEHSRWFDFETEARMERDLSTDESVRARWVPEGLTVDHGSVALVREDPGRAWQLSLPGPPASDRHSLVIEGRVRLPDAVADQGELSIAVTDVGRATNPSTTPISITTTAGDDGARPALSTRDLSADDWYEFSIGIPGSMLPSGPDGAPASEPVPVTVGMRIVCDGVLQIDELVLRSAHRLEGLLAGGHPRNAGATEGTRELKRILRRGAEERLCLALPPPSTLEITVEPGPLARLRFGVTSLSPPNPVVATELVVAVSREGRFEETMLRTTLNASHATRFVDHELDFTRFANEPVRLQFRVTTADPDSAPILALADPVLEARQETPRPHVFWVAYPASLLDANPELFAQMRTEGMTLTGFEPADDRASINWLSGFTSRTAPGGQGRRPVLVPSRTPTLAEVMTERGYLTYTALETLRTPGLMQGFPRRWSTEGDPVLATMAAIQPDRPNFVGFELPATGGDVAWYQLLGELENHSLLENSVLLLVPATGSGPVHVRWPGGALQQQTSARAIRMIDLAPSLLSWLQLPPCESFAGQTFHLDSLTDLNQVPISASDLVPRNPLSWSPALPERDEVVLDDTHRLPDGGPR